MWGLLLRDEQQRPVGFHAVAWQTGHGSPREARVVILPEFQGALTQAAARGRVFQ